MANSNVFNEGNKFGILNARKGSYKGKTYLFTHSKPGASFSDDIPVDISETGWIDNDNIRWL